MNSLNIAIFMPSMRISFKNCLHVKFILIHKNVSQMVASTRHKILSEFVTLTSNFVTHLMSYEH